MLITIAAISLIASLIAAAYYHDRMDIVGDISLVLFALVLSGSAVAMYLLLILSPWLISSFFLWGAWNFAIVVMIPSLTPITYVGSIFLTAGIWTIGKMCNVGK